MRKRRQPPGPRQVYVDGVVAADHFDVRRALLSNKILNFVAHEIVDGRIQGLERIHPVHREGYDPSACHAVAYKFYVLGAWRMAHGALRS
ncbi:hypothetical protein [Verrucosispora sp. NA02020]|uniref:hypothetical protein n=1 Tax=Verrucosispora sp. NA02020 TaxID=2742132 RepID=UPI003D748048